MKKKPGLSVRKIIAYQLVGMMLFLSAIQSAYAAADGAVSGIVRDSSGAVVSDATVSLLTAQKAVVASAKTDAQGKFAFSDIPQGSYLLVVSSRGFADRRQAVTAASGDIEVIVEPRPIIEEVTITTNPGNVESAVTVSQQVNVINEEQIEERAKAVVAQVANEEVGVHLQRTSPTVSGIFIRGLTGNKVNVFIDGVRYSNASQRGGVNSFLNLIDPSNLQAVEILRGPNSAQYGSDAIGGSVQFLTFTPAFSPSDADFRGKFSTSFDSADASFGSNLLTTFATKKFALLTNITGRRINTTRAGRGADSHNATFDSGGVYAQDIFEAIPNKLRLIGNVRWSGAKYKARAQKGLFIANRILFPDDSLEVDSVTYRAGLVVTPVEGLSLSANFSRGFRAPHITDLGTLGLTGSGFEVAAPDVAGLGGTVGSTAGSTAVSTGLAVEQVQPEKSMNYEVGAHYHNRRFDTGFAFFVNDIDDNIVKQALILPPGATGKLLGTTPITSQLPSGVVFVAASTNPVLVRANFDDVRIYGFEHTLNANITPDWSAGTIFTYLRARDRRTNLPPNIEGGTPAPDGWLKLRYSPAGKRWWVEPYMHAAARQDRLSSLDLEDRRTGAARSRGAIANFFNNGARFRGLVSPGPDGVLGNVDDRLIATGETLLQIQDRVLGVGVTSAPLYTAVPGYVTFNVRGGVRFGERHEILLDFSNIGDRNYRGISWGIDAPGRGVYLKYNTRF
jgi:outer membrane receptor protein involved in Fe transport